MLASPKASSFVLHPGHAHARTPKRETKRWSTICRSFRSMATHCNGFKVVASQDCDGRSLDITLAAEQAIFGLIPTAIFLVAAVLRVFHLSRQPIRTIHGRARKAKLVRENINH